LIFCFILCAIDFTVMYHCWALGYGVGPTFNVQVAVDV